ncbi:tegument protein UL88 [macacine betaherpesvirus 9]|uniref:Tegument protein UL88 n=1 Tax=macacine betaherpesvirus 9 TaxID=2560568 RepID=A0A191S3U9_9BETA|nr:tegument protein UL88 [macacine betaherpesvirus 9]ANC96564.1 tegument protein UL88 [macacine betaherpesvirus 9]
MTEFHLWRDCGLHVDAETVMIHEIVSSDLGNLLQLKTDKVLMSNLCAYITGCLNRSVFTVVLYWHSYSEIIYTLTGLIHCEKIVIECGTDISKSSSLIYDKPKILLLRDKLEPIELKWKCAVKVVTIQKKLSPYVPEIFPILPNHQFVLENEELPIFRDRIAYILKVVVTKIPTDSKKEQHMINKCHELANLQTFAINGNILESFVLTQVCLFKLGAVNMWEEITGNIRTKTQMFSKSFIEHKEFLSSCYLLCSLLNSIYKHRSLLPEMLENNQIVHTVVKKYYSECNEVSYKTLLYATNVIYLFSQNKDISEVLSNIKKHISIDTSASKMDLTRFLEACLGH